MARVHHKITNCRGESLAETLVSVLIISIGSIMFASMAIASGNIVNQSETIFAKNMEQKNQVESGLGDSTDNTSSDSSDEMKVTISGTLTNESDDTTSESGTLFCYSLNNFSIHVTPKKAGDFVYGYTK